MGETCNGAQQCVATAEDSCSGLCNNPFISGASCQCDALCFTSDDCCEDICTTCVTQYASACGIEPCASGFTVGALPFTTSNDTTTGGTNQYSYGNETCAGETGGWGNGSPEHVWSFTAPTTALYLITLEAQYDSTLYAVTGCPIDSTTCLKADDIVGASQTESITIDVNANQTVFIVVDGWANIIDVSSASGAYTLSVEYSP